MCKDKNLYPTVWKFQVYGTKDSPAVSTYALTQCPVEYKKRTRTTNLVCPIILENIQRSLSQLTYVDDHHESANSSQILNFFKDLPNLSLITGHFKLELGQKEIYMENKFSMFDPRKTGIENMLIISEKYLPNKESFSANPRINVSSEENYICDCFFQKANCQEEIALLKKKRVGKAAFVKLTLIKTCVIQS